MGQRTRPRYGHLLATAALGLGLLNAQPTRAEDLVEVYQMALQQAPQLRIAEAAARAAEAGRREARAELLPSLDLNAGYSSDSATVLNAPATSPYNSSVGTTTEYPSTSYGLTLSQPLYNGQASSAYRAARLTGRQQQKLYSATRQNLMLQVARDYFAVLAAQQALELSAAERAALGQQLREIRERQRVGLATLTEVHETQARHDLAVADALQAELELDRQRELLAELIG
ncbi:MAG: TolC family protein, partial [Gammaproteobacteria bacterium]|nr:TolC family protein [Gammaproteobacteria bacterium]